MTRAFRTHDPRALRIIRRYNKLTNPVFVRLSGRSGHHLATAHHVGRRQPGRPRWISTVTASELTSQRCGGHRRRDRPSPRLDGAHRPAPPHHRRRPSAGVTSRHPGVGLTPRDTPTPRRDPSRAGRAPRPRRGIPRSASPSPPGPTSRPSKGCSDARPPRSPLTATGTSTTTTSRPWKTGWTRETAEPRSRPTMTDVANTNKWPGNGRRPVMAGTVRSLPRVVVPAQKPRWPRCRQG
jgi:hypothetical protein